MLLSTQVPKFHLVKGAAISMWFPPEKRQFASRHSLLLVKLLSSSLNFLESGNLYPHYVARYLPVCMAGFSQGSW